MTGMDAEITQEMQAAFWRVYNETLDIEPERRTAAGLAAAFALMPAPVFVITDEVLAVMLPHADMGSQWWLDLKRKNVRIAAEAAGFRVEDRAQQ